MADDQILDETPAEDERSSEEQMPATYEEWFESQNDEIKGLLENQTASLKSALQSERERNKELSKTLKSATKELDVGTEARKQLDAAIENLEAAQLKADFYEEVAGIVTNPKLAFIAAREIGAISKNGKINFEAIKAAYPELFELKKKTAPPAGAGNGAGQSGAPKGDMNAFIRAAAGLSNT